jgi:monomeric sarcosine oxidase
MNNTSDVIIIGLGAMGSATSMFLSHNGIKVIGFDSYSPPHEFGSSLGHTRVIREAYHEGTTYVPIVQRAYEIWFEMNENSKVPIIETYGGLLIGRKTGDIENALKSANKYDIPIKKMTTDEISQKFSVLNPPKEYIGLLESRGGAVFVENSINHMLNTALNNGSIHKYNERVVRWSKKSNYYLVETNLGNYKAEKLVFSSGAWITKLLPTLKLPIKIERQVLFWFSPRKNPDKFKSINLPNSGWDLDNGLSFYTMPNLENRGFKVAMHHNGEFVDPDTLIRESNDSDLKMVRDFLEEYIPDGNGELIDSKVCMYTDTPDQDFLIDSHPDDENIIICSPCSGHGFKFTPAIGEICSSLIINNSTKFDLDKFSLERLI